MVEMKGLNEEEGGGRYNSMEYGVQQQQQQPPSQQQFPPPRQQGDFNTKPKDFMDNLLTAVNQDLLVSKTFYFFFFSAFGSLFPLLAVYFKQLGMNATQSGLLIGIRPLVEFLSAPLWGGLADRFRKGKIMLLCSLGCWIVFTLALAFVQPPASSCIDYNDTHHFLYHPTTSEEREKRSIDWMDVIGEDERVQRIPQVIKRQDLPSKPTAAPMPGRKNAGKTSNKLPPHHTVGMSPNTVEYTLNYNQEKHTSYISPPFSSIVYKYEDVQSVFFLILLLVVLGEFFSAPAITLADSATLSFLGENLDHYGRQRMFGSLGWGLAMFFVGIALDHSTAFPNHPCGPDEMEKNYTICFATFSVLMGCAFISATQFRFDYDIIDEDIQMKAANSQPRHQNQTIITAEDTAPGILDLSKKKEEPAPPPAPKSTVFAQTTRKLPEWFTVLRTFATVRYGAFLYVTWFMGFGVGLVFTFLFWHLQDLGGSPTLFGVASVINHISEIFAYFFSFRFIRQIGHVKVLCVGLMGNVCRFLYISWLKNPWWVLPFEFIQGITHAAVWAACCSYITQATPSTLRSSAQGVLQGLHHGLGRGCGAVIGGVFVNYFGTQITFRGYGFACLLVLIIFVFINYYRKDKGFASFQDEQEPECVVEETVHLAPHGVPANPMARSLSKQNLTEPGAPGADANQQYGSTNQWPSNTSGGFLNIPGGGGGGGGGDYQGVGGTTYSDVNMNQARRTTDRQYSRGSLAAAFNPKGIMAQASSPEAVFHYDSIKRDFQAYSEIEDISTNKISDDPKSKLLTAPKLKTTPFAPQPEPKGITNGYNW